MDTLLIALGVVLMVDAIFSILHYPEQSWLRDHSVRVLRALIAITIIIKGVMMG